MRFLYALSHPSDRLDDERAGHVVRPRQLLAGLAAHGHEVHVTEAAGTRGSQAVARSYWSVRSAIPVGLALTARDAARIAQNHRFAARLERDALAHGPDVVIETQVAFSTAAAVVARRRALPLVADDVSPADEDEDVYDVRLRRTARRRRRATLATASLVVVTSEAIRESVVAEGVPVGKTLVLPNGIPPAALAVQPGSPALRAEHGFAGTDVVVAYAGSFQPFHRLGLLVEALARPEVPSHVRLLLVGDGDERPAVERLADDLRLRDRVVFAGRVHSDDVAAHLQAADVGVLPATAEYTNPMKLYDYLAAGLAVVAPAQRAVREVLAGAPARLFEPGSVPALAGALADLATDGRARRRMGVEARGSAAEQTWERRAARLLEELESRGLAGPASRRATQPRPARSGDAEARSSVAPPRQRR